MWTPPTPRQISQRMRERWSWREQAAAGRSLDDTFFHARYQVELDVRWVLIHMIEEYARHNGHADLLRERVDGSTGE